LADQLLATLPEPLERVLFLSTGGEANEAALRMAKLSTGRFEVLSLTRSWHGVTAGASAITHAGARSGYGPATPGAFALPAPAAPLRRRLRLLVSGGGLRSLRPGERRLAGRGGRRAGALGGRRDRAAAGLLRAACRAVRRARAAARPRRVPDRTGPPWRAVRV